MTVDAIQVRPVTVIVPPGSMKPPGTSYTPYANMADHSVVAWNELYESEASWASVFCFDKLPQKCLASFAI